MPRRNEFPGLYAVRYKGTVQTYKYQPPSADLPKGVPRPRAINLRTRDLEEAIRKLAKIRWERLQTDRTGHIGDLLRLAAADKLRDATWAPTTHRNAIYTIAEFARATGDPAAESLAADHVRAWHTQTAAATSASSAQHHLRTIRSLLGRLVTMGYLIENPAAALGIPKPRASRRERFCTRAERDRLVDSADDPALRFVLFAGFHAGLRYGEIAAARPDWFHVDDATGTGWITIQNDRTQGQEWDTKTDAARTVPLSREFVAFLADYGRPAPYMLRPDIERGAWRYRYDARVPFKKHAAAQGLGWVSFHTMRHTFGSLLTIAGVPEIKIIRWMGITRQTFERHYAGLNPHDDDINV